MPSWLSRPRTRSSAPAESAIRCSTVPPIVRGPQYLCCRLFSRTEFVQKYPVATKRIVRAFLKAADLCANEPARVAWLMVDQGFTPRFDYALRTLQELPYGVWRDHDPEDTIRFFTLRLNEAGLIKSDPQRLIAATRTGVF